MRNHEGYADMTAYKAIKNAGKNKKNKAVKTWGEHLTYTMNEVSGFPRK